MQQFLTCPIEQYCGIVKEFQIWGIPLEDLLCLRNHGFETE